MYIYILAIIYCIDHFFSHYKDSLLKVGWPSQKSTSTFDHGTYQVMWLTRWAMKKKRLFRSIKNWMVLTNGPQRKLLGNKDPLINQPGFHGKDLAVFLFSSPQVTVRVLVLSGASFHPRGLGRMCVWEGPNWQFDWLVVFHFWVELDDFGRELFVAS